MIKEAKQHMAYKAVAFRNRSINRLEEARTVHAVSEVGVAVSIPSIMIAGIAGADATIALPLMLLFMTSAAGNVVTTPGMFRRGNL